MGVVQAMPHLVEQTPVVAGPPHRFDAEANVSGNVDVEADSAGVLRRKGGGVDRQGSDGIDGDPHARVHRVERREHSRFWKVPVIHPAPEQQRRIVAIESFGSDVHLPREHLAEQHGVLLLRFGEQAFGRSLQGDKRKPLELLCHVCVRGVPQLFYGAAIHRTHLEEKGVEGVQDRSGGEIQGSSPTLCRLVGHETADLPVQDLPAVDHHAGRCLKIVHPIGDRGCLLGQVLHCKKPVQIPEAEPLDGIRLRVARRCHRPDCLQREESGVRAIQRILVRGETVNPASIPHERLGPDECLRLGANRVNGFGVVGALRSTSRHQGNAGDQDWQQPSENTHGCSCRWRIAYAGM